MAMNGIFCLETTWHERASMGLRGLDERKPPSTQSLLELLERLRGVPFVYHDVATKKELDFYLGKWCGRNTNEEDYRLGHLGILYLGFHGTAGQIHLDDGSVDLIKTDQRHTTATLAKSFKRENQYNLSGSVIHFASCSVMDSPETVKKFKEDVGASCVSGYTEEVDYAPSWAFELMYLDLLSSRMSEPNVNAHTLRELFGEIQEDPKYSGLAEALGFKMI